MCPWIDWEPATMHFCEGLLCGWVRQPANTYSNLGFVVVGLMILKSLTRKFGPYHVLAIASILIGITSAIYHASMTFFWQVFDVTSMFMLILIVLCFNLLRLQRIKTNQFLPVYLALLIGSTGAMLLFKGKSGEILFGIWVTIAAVLEFLLHKKKTPTNHKYFYYALGTFLLAVLAWGGDLMGWWCDPDNHIVQGHAAWHLLDAVAVWFLYKFYDQFHFEAS